MDIYYEIQTRWVDWKIQNTTGCKRFHTNKYIWVSHQQVYMSLPHDFKEDKKDRMVCKLNKSLYGLK